MVWDENYESHRPFRESILQMSNLGERDMVSRPTACPSAAASAPHTKAPKCRRSRARSGRAACACWAATGNVVEAAMDVSGTSMAYMTPTIW